MRDVKQTVVALVAQCLEYYIYEHNVLESKKSHVHSIIYPACALVLCYVISPDVMIILGAGYMLMCSKLLRHVQCFDFLLMYPFVWSIIHSTGIPYTDYLPILSVKHASYALQRLTPGSIHTKVSAPLCGGLYVMYDHLLKLKNDAFKPEPSYGILALNVVVNACVVSLWESYDYTKTSTADAIGCACVVVAYKLPVPVYVKIMTNGAMYFVRHVPSLPRMMYTESLNACVTLAIKEELYDTYAVDTHVRYVEHFVGFMLGYALLLVNSEIIRTISVCVLCASLCAIRRVMVLNEKQDCRCSSLNTV
jgi:hypothetical protein